MTLGGACGCARDVHSFDLIGRDGPSECSGCSYGTIDRQEEVRHEAARFHPSSSIFFSGPSCRHRGVLHQWLRLQQLGSTYSGYPAAPWVEYRNARVGTVGDSYWSLALSVTRGLARHTPEQPDGHARRFASVLYGPSSASSCHGSSYAHARPLRARSDQWSARCGHECARSGCRATRGPSCLFIVPCRV